MPYMAFLNILFKTIEEEKPDYLTVAFDLHAPTFRHQMYDAYKGTRKPMPQELREQVPVMKDVLAAMGVCMISMEGMRRMTYWVLWLRKVRQKAWRSQSSPGTGIFCSLPAAISASESQRPDSAKTHSGGLFR